MTIIGLWRRSLGLLVALCARALPTLAEAASGGLAPDGETVVEETVSGGKAKLVKGKAIAPDGAPKSVKQVIAAANKIRNKPYKWGGGHGSWNAKGYDCSGAVSYALHGAKLLDSPLNSSGLAHYGKKGKGEWITVYGAGGHAYVIVAGLRFDTSLVSGNGPGWSKDKRSTSENYKARHPRNL